MPDNEVKLVDIDFKEKSIEEIGMIISERADEIDSLYIGIIADENAMSLARHIDGETAGVFFSEFITMLLLNAKEGPTDMAINMIAIVLDCIEDIKREGEASG